MDAFNIRGDEVTTLAQIRDGDFHQERYLNPVWRTVMDAPIFAPNVKVSDAPDSAVPNRESTL